MSGDGTGGDAISGTGDVDPTRPVMGATGDQDSAPDQPPSLPVQRGSAVGRYIVVDPLGAGGMGEVYSAYDPELDRRVALKLLRVRAKTRHKRAAERLLREAQAMAKLSHPNVVTVFDAGTYDDQVFIAMEQIEGRTLRAWLSETTHDWREVVRVMIAAGRGLAAAHRAGLMHRDFKPANVIVGEDGRVVVLDFGLARRTDDSSRESGPVDLAAESGTRLTDSLTETGLVMGTPAFMAPEQFLGGSVGAHSDQFAFCVVLFRGLFGVAPFAGVTYGELARAVEAGALIEPPGAGRVPRSIRAALQRGLGAEPGSRFADMDGLLAVLERALSRRRRLAWTFGAGLGIVGLATAAWAASRSAPGCPEFEDQLAGVWDDDARARVDAGLRTAGGANGEETSGRVRAALDTYAEQWLQHRVDACAATVIRHERSDTLMDLQVRCLDRRMHELRTLVILLTEADRGVAVNSVNAASGLTAIAPCADTTRLLAAIPPPERADVAAAVATLRDEIAEAATVASAGRYGDALQRAEPLWERARQVDYSPVEAESASLVAQIQLRLGHPEQAKEFAETALYLAIGAGDEATQARVLLVLIDNAANHTPDARDADRLVRHFRALMERLGTPSTIEAMGQLYIGNVHARRREWDAADAAYRTSVDVAGDTPSLAPTKVSALANQAMVRARTGQLSAALVIAKQGLALARKHLGEFHPTVGAMLQNLGAMQSDAGNYDAALVTLRETLDVLERSLGREHHEYARALQNLSVVQQAMGRHAEALANVQEALAIKRRVLPAADPSVAHAANNVGDALLVRDRPDEALPYFEEAARIWGDSPSAIYAEIGLAEVHLALGNAATGLPYAEEALRRLETAPADLREAGKVRFIAGRVLHAAGEREAGLALARRAHADFVASESAMGPERAEIQRFFADLGEAPP